MCSGGSRGRGSALGCIVRAETGKDFSGDSDHQAPLVFWNFRPLHRALSSRLITKLRSKAFVGFVEASGQFFARRELRPAAYTVLHGRASNLVRGFGRRWRIGRVVVRSVVRKLIHVNDDHFPSGFQVTNLLNFRSGHNSYLTIGVSVSLTVQRIGAGSFRRTIGSAHETCSAESPAKYPFSTSQSIAGFNRRMMLSLSGACPA